VQVTADFADPAWPDAAAAALDATLPRSARICLIHNAGSKHAGPMDTLDGPSLRQCLEINAVAPALLNRLVLPAMAPGSSILYVGSTLSHRATRAMAAYTMSKHALAGLMRSTAQDLAGRGIHTACICPGFTETEMLRGYGAEAMGQLAGLVTQDRLIDPDEIAGALLFAAENAVINGAMINADLAFREP
jgi:NAD(P)-dependent dehydrogenase (short-subunit alcohol dehydrogenase family)